MLIKTPWYISKVENNEQLKSVDSQYRALNRFDRFPTHSIPSRIITESFVNIYRWCKDKHTTQEQAAQTVWLIFNQSGNISSFMFTRSVLVSVSIYFIFAALVRFGSMHQLLLVTKCFHLLQNLSEILKFFFEILFGFPQLIHRCGDVVPTLVTVIILTFFIHRTDLWYRVRSLDQR